MSNSVPAKISLEQWQASGHYFNHKYGDIFYRTHPSIFIGSKSKEQNQPSEKPVLLLIHGFPTSSWDWHKLWFPLSEHYQLVAADMLGFGFSDKPKSSDYRIGEQADIQEDLLQHLGISSYHILAHDYGDTVTQELLARNIKRLGTIKSVALLNGGLFPETHQPLLVQKLLLSPIGSIVSRLMTEKKFQSSFDTICKQPIGVDELAGFWQQVQYNQGQKIFHKLIRYISERRLHRERWVSALQHLSPPIALINGSADPISGAHMVSRYRELVRNEYIYEIPDAGHYPQMETPSRVLDAFLAFEKDCSE
ncbi:MAG: alpha/beta hydrolase [Alcanivorax sp.]|jgi:pimeloyl-ACP methyl ester carboxylesterase|nr:MAG: alpha/beta hydrolase [Oceanobacter sp.]|tara:strand:+ start:2733 stop:3656 length:924 start_codon:yes stop_codon:yes gene_type:complete